MKTPYVSPVINTVAFEQKNLMANYSVVSNVFRPAGGGSGDDAM